MKTQPKKITDDPIGDGMWVPSSVQKCTMSKEFVQGIVLTFLTKYFLLEFVFLYATSNRCNSEVLRTIIVEYLLSI